MKTQIPCIAIALVSLGLIATPILTAQMIQNPSFETPGVGPLGYFYSFQYNPTGAAWTFTGNAGIAANGSGFTSYENSHAYSPYGNQFAFLQSSGGVGGVMSQTFSNILTGTYSFAFSASQRQPVGSSFETQIQTVTVLVDDVTVGSFTPADTNWHSFQTTPISLTAGNHVLTFTNLPAAGDSTVFVDMVSAMTTKTGVWSALVNQAPVQINTMFLLSDGTVLGNQFDWGSGHGGAWYRLTPDIKGSYVNGTWSQVASMEYTRLFFATQVLTNGQVFVAGGEYGTGTAAAEVYDAVSNAWTETPIPTNLLNTNTGESFSDSISEILPDGNVLIAPVYRGGTLIYNVASNTWLAGPDLVNGVSQDEASWVKLPDNSILTDYSGSTTSERYIPALNTWIPDATVPVPLYSVSTEIGAALLLPNGKAFFLGDSGNTALYTPSGSTNFGTWTVGPVIPNGLTTPDAPAAMLVNGHVLCAVTDQTNTSYFEYDPDVNAFTQTYGPTGLTSSGATDYLRMLDLPDGTVLLGNNSQQFYVYRPAGSIVTSGKPTVLSISINADQSYHLRGMLLNGISEGAAYGDDAQMNSNYPLVRMTNNATGNVYYARTYNWSSTGVMTGTNIVTTDFAVPTNLPAGTHSLVAVANGIASNPISFIYAPELSVAYSGGKVIVSWPTSVTGWALQTNESIASGTWANFSGTVVSNAASFTPTSGSLFFRLSHQ